MACRLIPLDKMPGLRPIGIGEVLRRIIGKVVKRSFREEISECTGALQMCTGKPAGCEAAIHGMRQIFKIRTQRQYYSLMPKMHLTA